MNFKGTMNLGGQTSTGTPENALTWDENATINADSADFNFVQPTSASATTGNDINVAFGGHKIATITGTSSGYIYPHFQDDLEVAGAITVNGTDKFYQENGTIEIGGSLTGTGEFLANNGAFKFSGIDFCD